jgi:spore coat polysaccharide biosynthesis protein SpsF
MKIGCIIQARMGSTRLSGKVMKELEGKTVLEHVIERVKQSKMIDEIIIATTVHDRDDVIESEALRCGIKVFRGSEGDVLSRYFYAAKENKIDVIVRITSDCPLIDWNIIDDVISKFINNEYDIVTNAGLDQKQRTFPRGLDLEVFSFSVLSNAFNNATERYQREHVSPYIYETSEKIHVFQNAVDYSKYRWTLDTEEDWILINKIFKRLYTGLHNFGLMEIIELMEREPELNEINKHIEQKKVQ